MRSKPFSIQPEEFDVMTARLSPAARGVWITIRMQMARMRTYVMEDTADQLESLLRCPSEILLTSVEEFKLKPSCGFRVEIPATPSKRTTNVRLVYEADEKLALFSSTESLRLSNYRESKRKSPTMPMPENWKLTDRMRDFGLMNGMSTATVQHEFERCRIHHLENEFTEIGWNFRVFQTWVLNWISFGRHQVLTTANGQVMRQTVIPPFPGPDDPIARQAWRQAYGDPKNPRLRS